MNSQAFLLALIGVTPIGGVIIHSVSIKGEEHPTCNLQKHSYACIDKMNGNTYAEAKKTLMESVKYKADISKPGSLWQSIYKLLQAQE